MTNWSVKKVIVVTHACISESYNMSMKIKLLILVRM
jgi:hypothetical protein